MPLNPHQTTAANAYCGGEFSYIEEAEEAEHVGDTLFTFVIREMGEADDKAHAVEMMNTAIKELEEVRDALERSG